MVDYIAVTNWDSNNRVTSSERFSSEGRAVTFLSGTIDKNSDAFVAVAPASGNPWEWVADPILETLTYSPELGALRARRKVAVTALLSAKFNAGRIHNGNTYQLRSQDRQNLNAIKNMLNGGAANPHGGTYRSAANANVTLNDTQMEALCDDVFAYCRDLIKNAAALKDSIDAASTATAINTVDINSGWPSNGA